MNRKLIAVLLFCGLSLLAGCSDGGPELREVTGRVTVDGKPVPGAILTFVPTAGGSPSYGGTDNDGNYKLMFTDTKYGAMVGITKFRSRPRGSRRANGPR